LCREGENGRFVHNPPPLFLSHANTLPLSLSNQFSQKPPALSFFPPGRSEDILDAFAIVVWLVVLMLLLVAVVLPCSQPRRVVR
jgi:ABC-type Fe3+ transport system permease subunit